MLADKLRLTNLTPTYSDISIIEYGASGSSGTITFSNSLLEDDIVVLFVGFYASGFFGSVGNVPSGYLCYGTSESSVYQCGVFVKTMGATPDTTIDITASNGIGYLYYVLRGAQPESPVLTVASASGYNPPSVSVIDKSVVMTAAFALDGSTASFSAAPSGYTGFSTQDITASNDIFAAAAYKTMTSSGSEDPGTFTLVNTASAYFAYSLVIRPYTALFQSGVPFIVSSASQQNILSGTTLTINKPIGTQGGDLMIAVMSGNDNNWTDSTFTEIADQLANPGLRIAYKVAGGSEPSSYSFTNSSSSNELSGCIITYRNAVYDTIGSFTSGTNPLIVPSITVSSNDSILIAAASQSANYINFNTPSGMTARFIDHDAETPSIAVFDQSVDAGSTGTKSIASIGSATSISGILLSIKPG